MVSSLHTTGPHSVVEAGQDHLNKTEFDLSRWPLLGTVRKGNVRMWLLSFFCTLQTFCTF